MIGFYDYTVVLTYLSLISAVSGMAMAMTGHPIWATISLLFCGLCDMFDGKVARTKKNRTPEEKAFGIQIDSLSDVVAFGVLPAVMLLSLCRGVWAAYVVAPLYVLSGLIRLAYFNVTEELRQKSTDECRRTYSGLPITAAAMIFPMFYCIVAVFCNIHYGDIAPFRDMFGHSVCSLLLCVVTALTGLCFVLPFHMRKPHGKDILLLLLAGILIAAVLLMAIFL